VDADATGMMSAVTHPSSSSSSSEGRFPAGSVFGERFRILGLLGRGDLQGALRVAAFVFVCTMIPWLLMTHYVGAIVEFYRLLAALGEALFAAALLWVLYMALEPYVRRRWPQSLISWTRVLTGILSDPVVTGHILIGTALGVGYTLLFDAGDIVGEVSSGSIRFDEIENLLGPARSAATPRR